LAVATTSIFSTRCTKPPPAARSFEPFQGHTCTFIGRLLWAGLAGSARQNVRKAESNGVAVRESRDVDAIRVFHRMHCHVRKSKYRLLAQPVAFLENFHQEFAPEDRLDPRARTAGPVLLPSRIFGYRVFSHSHCSGCNRLENIDFFFAKPNTIRSNHLKDVVVCSHTLELTFFH
jgi:hypothetical protein